MVSKFERAFVFRNRSSSSNHRPIALNKCTTTKESHDEYTTPIINPDDTKRHAGNTKDLRGIDRINRWDFFYCTSYTPRHSQYTFRTSIRQLDGSDQLSITAIFSSGGNTVCRSCYSLFVLYLLYYCHNIAFSTCKPKTYSIFPPKKWNNQFKLAVTKKSQIQKYKSANNKQRKQKYNNNNK